MKRYDWQHGIIAEHNMGDYCLYKDVEKLVDEQHGIIQAYQKRIKNLENNLTEQEEEIQKMRTK